MITHCAVIFGAKVLTTMNAAVARRLPLVIACAEKRFVRTGIAKAKLMQNPIPITAMKRLASVTDASKRSMMKWATKKKYPPQAISCSRKTLDTLRSPERWKACARLCRPLSRESGVRF